MRLQALKRLREAGALDAELNWTQA